VSVLSGTRRLLAAGVLVICAACTLTPVETPDPAAIPTGPLPSPSDATGPVVELGSNVMEGRGWRYLIYPTGEDWCLMIETVGVSSAGCGDVLPAEGEVFGTWGSGTELGGGVTAIDGIVSDDVATVWLVLENGARAPAQMLPLDEAGLNGTAFLRLVPGDVVVTHLQAVAMSGEILETIELP
jgi:hypothetical protein